MAVCGRWHGNDFHGAALVFAVWNRLAKPAGNMAPHAGRLALFEPAGCDLKRSGGSSQFEHVSRCHQAGRS